MSRVSEPNWSHFSRPEATGRTKSPPWTSHSVSHSRWQRKWSEAAGGYIHWSSDGLSVSFTASGLFDLHPREWTNFVHLLSLFCSGGYSFRICTCGLSTPKFFNGWEWRLIGGSLVCRLRSTLQHDELVRQAHHCKEQVWSCRPPYFQPSSGL